MTIKRSLPALAAAIAVVIAVLLSVYLIWPSKPANGPTEADGVESEIDHGPFTEAPDAGPGSTPNRKRDNGAPDVDRDSKPLSIFGTVTTGAGAAVQGVQVAAVTWTDWTDCLADPWKHLLKVKSERTHLIGKSFGERLRTLLRDATTTATNREGSYAFRGLEDGRWVIVFSHRKYYREHRVRTTADDICPLRCDVGLRSALGLSGKVVDSWQRAVADARIRWQSSRVTLDKSGAHTRLRLPPVRTERDVAETGVVSSAADGSFYLGPLSPIRYDLVVSGSGYQTRAIFGVEPGGEDLLVTLETGSSVTARVLGEKREPVVGAEVSLLPRRSGRPSPNCVPCAFADRSGGDEIPRSLTREDGRAHIAGIQAGLYELVVVKPGLPPYVADVEVQGEVSDLGELTLPSPVKITGQVYTPDGLPVFRARVTARRSFRAGAPVGLPFSTPLEDPLATSATTDSDGRFEILGVDRSAHEIRAVAEGFSEVEIRNVVGGAEDVDLFLAPGLEIRGQLLDEEDHSAVVGASVQSLFGQSAESNEKGLFTISGVSLPLESRSAHAVTLRVEHPRYGLRLKSIPQREDAGPVPIYLSPRPVADGLVLDADDHPVSGASVWLESPIAQPAGWDDGPVNADHEGRFHLPLPGRSEDLVLAVVIAASSEGFATGRSVPTTLGSFLHSDSEVTIILSPGVSLDGTVRDTNGEAIAGASIQASRVEPSQRDKPYYLRPRRRKGYVTTSGSAGSYGLDQLAIGEYEFEIRAVGFATERLTVELEDRPATVDITMKKGGAFEGRVVDKDANPIAGATVSAFLEDERTPQINAGAFMGGGDAWKWIRRGLVEETVTRSDSEGHYTLKNVSDGSFIVVAQARGHDTAAYDGLRIEGGPVVLPDLVLVSLSSISGVVLDAVTGAELGGFQVRALLKEDWLGSRPAVSLLVPLEYRESDGQFIYDGLAEGLYELAIDAEGYLPFRQELSLDGGQDLEIVADLEPAISVRGVAIDVVTGAPIPGVRIEFVASGADDSASVARGSGSSILRTDFDGSFVVNGLPTGRYQVHAAHSFFYTEDAPQVIDLHGQAPPPIELHLHRGGRLVGSISNLPESEFEPMRAVLIARRTSYAEKQTPPSRATKVRSGTDSRPSPSPDPVVPPSEPAGGVKIHINPDGRFTTECLPPGLYGLELRLSSVPTSALDDERDLETSLRTTLTQMGQIEIRSGLTQTVHLDYVVHG